MPKIVDHEEQRRHIASAAITAIDAAGLDGARLRDVAEVADVTTGAVTHYFDGKEAVLEAALEEVVRRILDKLESIPEPRTAEDFHAMTAAFLPLDAQSRREWRVWLAFWGKAIVEPRLRELHKSYYDEIVGRLIASLREAGASPRAARLAGDAIVAAIDGVGVRATLEPEEWPARRQRDTLHALLAPLIADVFS